MIRQFVFTLLGQTIYVSAGYSYCLLRRGEGNWVSWASIALAALCTLAYVTIAMARNSADLTKGGK